MSKTYTSKPWRDELRPPLMKSVVLWSPARVPSRKMRRWWWRASGWRHFARPNRYQLNEAEVYGEHDDNHKEAPECQVAVEDDEEGSHDDTHDAQTGDVFQNPFARAAGARRT